jgi:hypothetical protein
MKKATTKKEKSEEAPQPFGQGLVDESVRPARHITPRAIERRLYQLLEPLIKAQGGMVATLDEVGETGLFGLAITFTNSQSFDVVIREARK